MLFHHADHQERSPAWDQSVALLEYIVAGLNGFDNRRISTRATDAFVFERLVNDASL